MTGLYGAQTLVAASNEPDYPTIQDFLPPEILFQGTPFAINRIILVRIIATVVLLLVLGITASRAKLIPGRWQSAVEWVLDFVKNNIVYEVMGELRGKRYVPMITTMFLSITIFNLCGEIAGLNIAATATIMMPLVFAIWTFCQYWIAAAREKGLGAYLKEELIPDGVPFPVLLLMAPMNLLELLIIRPLSLTIRLFANMMAGHIVLALCLATTQFFLFEVSNKALVPLGGLMFVAGFAMTLFEMFIACLQAFIFSILSTVYINLSYPEND
ncbi:MAG: F0F1 ATP synthase subunit A [Bifidobacterium crudilactis]|jgi:F-type H+-transporting ATPase subunit a|uniref:F0F1 ATP synthase subunit A n=1 Tax=Bifidobacterium crudilactis TaxID=327277 RepID=UPI003A5BB10B